MIDYKINYISNNGKETLVKFTIYEGDFKDVEVFRPDSEKLVTVNQYIRSKTLGTKEIIFEGDVPIEKIRILLNEQLGIKAEEQKIEPISVQISSEADKLTVADIKEKK
jgi:hypothetical protein